MKLSTLPTAVAVATLVFAAVAATPTRAEMKEQTVTVGGAPMYPSKNIIQNAMNSKDHTTLVAAVKAAGLVETLQGSGPFTVFAPTNAAFNMLPKGTVEDLLKPENKAKLSKILTYHVVKANALSGAIDKMIKDDGGKHTINTVSGNKLVASMARSRSRMRTAAARWSRSPTSGNPTASSTSSITFCCPGKPPKRPAEPTRSAGRCSSSPMLLFARERPFLIDGALVKCARAFSCAHGGIKSESR
jgi:uncharacterized surface protein with fasciclin (FAS1) repeats